MQSDRYVDEATNYARRARRMANSYADTARGYAGDYADEGMRAARAMAGEARGHLQRGAGQLRDGAQDYADEFGGRIADHPLPYVMAAALLGFVLGRIFRA